MMNKKRSLSFWILFLLGCLILFFGRGTPGFSFDNYGSYTVILSIITLYGIGGLWFLIKNPVVN